MPNVNTDPRPPADAAAPAAAGEKTGPGLARIVVEHDPIAVERLTEAIARARGLLRARTRSQGSGGSLVSELWVEHRGGRHLGLIISSLESVRQAAVRELHEVIPGPAGSGEEPA